MTGCLYISPPVFPGEPERGVVPVVLADVLATLKEPLAGAIPFIPATATAGDIHKPKSVNLVRKLNIIGRTAVALAGDGKTIAHFIHEIKQQMPDLSRNERPMREIGDIANRVGVEAIGIHIMDPPDNKINSMMHNIDFELKNLGLGGAIGSGKKDLLDLCYKFEENLNNFPTNATIFDKVIGFCAAQSANRLAQEIIGRAGNAWGGYVEYAYWRNDLQTWVRGYNAAHYFFGINLISNGVASQVGLIRRAFGYYPGKEYARILSIYFPSSSSVDITDMVLDNTIEVECPDIELDGKKFWLNWRPEIATVTIIVPTPDGDYSYLTKMIDRHDINKIRWNLSRENMAFGLDEEFGEQLKREMIESIGLRYQGPDVI